jgi:hypothetical protein
MSNPYLKATTPSFGLPVGQISNSSTYSDAYETVSTAPTQFRFVTVDRNTSVGQSLFFTGSYDFSTNSFTTNANVQTLKAAFSSPLNLTSGLYIQVFMWTGGPGQGESFSNITATVTATVGCQATVAPSFGPPWLGQQYVLASFTSPSGTLYSFAQECGFDHLNWQNTIIRNPAAPLGNSVTPGNIGPLVASGNVAYFGVPISPLDPYCLSAFDWRGCSLIAPPAYSDPPAGSYTYLLSSPTLICPTLIRSTTLSIVLISFVVIYAFTIISDALLFSAAPEKVFSHIQ